MYTIPMDNHSLNQAELRSTALQFLKSQHLLHLASLNKVNHPTVASVLYYVTEDFKFYFCTRSNSRKFENLTHCQHVGFTVTSEQELLTVQGSGTAKTINDPILMGRMITHLAGVTFEPLSGSWPPPVMKIQGGSYHLIEITPDWLRLGDFRDSKRTGDYYYEVIAKAIA